MKKPKLSVTKKVILDNQGHWRYYAPGYTRSNPKFKPIAPTIDLQNYPQIQTERELAWFLLQKFGPGEYRLVATVKGRRGFWTFWKGIVDYKGYMFFQRSTNNVEIRRLNKDLQDAEDEGDEEAINEAKGDIAFEKEMAREDMKKKRYGLAPFIRSSGRRGDFHYWDEPDKAYEGVYNDWSGAEYN